MNDFEQDMFYKLEKENIKLKKNELSNPFELACREFLNSCSNTTKFEPQGCRVCTDLFVKHIHKLAKELTNEVS